MKSKTFVLSGTGAQVTPWYRVDSKQDQFSVGVMVDLAGGSDASFGIDLGFMDPSNVINPVITRSTTTATIPNILPAGSGYTAATFVPSFKTGDSVVVAGAGAPFDGTFALTNTAGVITYTVANSGPTVSNAGSGVTASMIRVDAYNTAQVASKSYAIVTPCNYMRLNVATATTGEVSVTFTQGSD